MTTIDLKKQDNLNWLKNAVWSLWQQEVNKRLADSWKQYDPNTQSIVDITPQTPQTPENPNNTQTNPVAPTTTPQDTTLIQKNAGTNNAQVWHAPQDVNIPSWNIVNDKNPPKIQTPQTPTTPQTTPKTQTSTPTTSGITLPQTIAEWKKQGSDITTLEHMIESRYGTVAENKNGVLTANINGVPYQWNIDNAWNPIKTKVWWENPDNIYNKLATWQTLSDTWIKQTKEYSQAKARYDLSSKYLTMTEDQLYNAYINWEISSTLEKDIVWNPNLAVAKEKYNKKIVTDNINNDSTTILNSYNRVNWNNIRKTKTTDFLQTLSDKLLSSFDNSWKDIPSFQSYMQNNYPDLVKDTRTLNQQNTDLKKLIDTRDTRLDNIIKEHPWISINRASMLAARENKDINSQIKSMSYEIGNLQANINYQSNMANKEYGYELNRQNRQDILNREQRATALNLFKTQQAQDFQRQQLADQRTYNETHKWISTNIIKEWDKQKLINSKTWEVIKTYDLATWTSTWGWGWTKLNENTLFNKDTWESKDIATGKITQWNGFNFIKAQEWFSPNAYYDVNGWAIWYGQHSINWQPVKSWDTITKETANSDLQNRIKNAKFNSLVKTPLNEDQQAALYDLEHNVWAGVWNFPNGKKIIDAVNLWDFQKASDIMANSGVGTTNAATWTVMNWLVNRRKNAAQLLLTKNYDTNKTSQYTRFVEDWIVPTWLKNWTTAYNQFIQQAQKWYINSKEKAFNAKWFNIENPAAFIWTSKKQKQAIATAINNVAPFIQSMDKIIKMVDKYWTETTLSNAGKKMNQEVRNAQLIAKEIYNLWVLNWPDLSLMEDIIANPTSIWANIQLWSDYWALLRSWKKTIIDNAIAKAKSVWLNYTWNTNTWNTDSWNTDSWNTVTSAAWNNYTY